MTAHMIFYVKMDAGFICKARLVTDGQKLYASTSMNYASVVSRDSVRVVLVL